ncbi:MAG: TetR/AcrR family transcriptional regulator [Burkholderiaceae bacterium]|nr:TetR/AcrR family transcriptional regulator [Burkholderiaceae bacterium]
MPTAAEAKAKPRWERRKDARPQELLSAALDLFVERGYAATRLDEVAACAGVSKGTLYLYFDNKEELFKAVVRENMVPPLADAEDMIARFDGHSSQLLRLCIHGWWDKIGATRLSGISKLMMAESGNFPDVARFYHEEVVSRGEALIRRIVERGIAMDEFRPVDATVATRVIIAPVLMLMMWRHSLHACHLDPIEPNAFLDCLVDLLTRGFEPAGARSC